MILTCLNCKNTRKSSSAANLVNIPVASSVPDSLNLFLKTEVLSKGNEAHFLFCKSKAEALISTSFSKVGNTLVLQVSRFNQLQSEVGKNVDPVLPSMIISFPCNDEEVHVTAKFKLTGLISHGGTFNSGHYTAFVKDQKKNWFFCNDSALFRCNHNQIDQKLPYLIFYKAY